MNSLDILVKQLWSMWAGLVATVPSLATALLIILLTWFAARFGRRIASRINQHTNMRESLKQLVETVVSIGTWILGSMIAATIVLPGLTPASLVAGLGAGPIKSLAAGTIG